MPGSNGVSRSEYVECRSLRHAWDSYGPEPGWALSLLCVRCTTRRLDDIDDHGELVARRYIYPSDYQMSKGEARPSTESLRMELIRRVRQSQTTRLRRGQVALLFTEE